MCSVFFVLSFSGVVLFLVVYRHSVILCSAHPAKIASVTFEQMWE